jgi:hypothetical protein
MVKEALIDATSAKKIVLFYDDNFQTRKVSFADGKLRLHCDANNFYGGMDKYANADIASML